MKLTTIVEIVLRIATLVVGLVPQVAGLAFFAFSVGSADLAMAVLATVALAVLTFLPRFRHTVLVSILVALVLVAESLWELVDTVQGGSEIAFSSAANLLLGFLWIVFHLVAGALGSNARKTDTNAA